MKSGAGGDGDTVNKFIQGADDVFRPRQMCQEAEAAVETVAQSACTPNREAVQAVAGCTEFQEA